MPRYRRECPPGSVQHLVQRFINREFRLDDRGRREYLRRLAALAAISDWQWLGYALMSSHLHQMALAGHASAESWLHPLNTGFAQYLNRTQNRLGPVFADRPKTIGCKEEHAARALAYIHNNPVRAGVVADPADSDWTSHRAYIGEAVAPSWLNVSAGLAACGFDSSPRGRLGFHSFVSEHARDAKDELLSGGLLQSTRVRVRRVLGPAVEIGHPQSTDGAGAAYPIWSVRGAARHIPREGLVDELLIEVAVATNCAVAEFCSGRRDDVVVRARRLTVLAGRRLGLPMRELGPAVGIARQSAGGLLRSNRDATEALEELARAIAQRVYAKR